MWDLIALFIDHCLSVYFEDVFQYDSSLFVRTKMHAQMNLRVNKYGSDRTDKCERWPKS